jgi:two-component system, LuxR family, response regulator FixJ
VRAPLIGVIDDEASVRESVSGLVSAAGYDAALFDSAEAFLGSDRVGDVDCLILDVRMPGMRVSSFSFNWRGETGSVPIIVVTADSDAARARALTQGAIAVLQKPFRAKALLDAIRSALGR